MSPTVPFAIVGCILLVIGVVSVSGVQFHAPELNPWRDAISQYVHTRHGILYRIQAYATGLGALSLLVALLVHGAHLPGLGLVSLGFVGLTRIGSGCFIADAHPPLSRNGQLHVLLGLGLLTFAALTAGMLTGSLMAVPPWHAISGYLAITAMVTVGCALATIVAVILPQAQPSIGRVQRGFYLAMFLWTMGVLIPLL
jgi:hypothetical protein